MDNFLESIKEKNYNLYFKGVFTGIVITLLVFIYAEVGHILTF